MKKNKQGFTLIELLVVIAIIGLLSTLSIVALNQARARARDARRVADVKQVQTALEMYYNDKGGYPPTVTSGSSIVDPAASSTIYMDIVPKPPLPADGNTAGCAGAAIYTYAVNTSFNGSANGSYTLQYCLGSVTGGIKSGLNTATPSGIALSGQVQ